jgi:hypothetical protein
MIAMFGGLAQDIGLHIGRHRDIEDLNGFIRKQLVDVAMHARDLVQGRDGLDVMATGLKPARPYATRWQSRMMKPAPIQPMRQSLRRGKRGR